MGVWEVGFSQILKMGGHQKNQILENMHLFNYIIFFEFHFWCVYIMLIELLDLQYC